MNAYSSPSVDAERLRMRTCSRQLRPAGTYYAARFSVSEEELLIQLCGTEDFLYEHNRRFRLAAEEAGYGHCYGEGPGEHARPYWDRAIQTTLRFFLGLETDGEFY